MPDINFERRQPPSPAWRRFHRSGDFWRNPIVISVVAGLIMNMLWAISVYAYQHGVESTHEYWRRYGAGIAAEATRTNNPDRLRDIISRVQNARAP